MLSQTSRSSARPAERPILAPAWLIAVLASLVGGALVLLYPRQDLERRLAASVDSADVALSVSYLHNLLRSDPGNTRLRVLMAHQQMILGELPEARTTLQPLLQSADPQVQREVLWARWELTQAEYWGITEDDEEPRKAKREELRALLQELVKHEWSTQRQVQLDSWISHFQPPSTAAATAAAISAQTHRQMAEQERDPAKAALLYEQAAREALGVSDYATCAQLFILARRVTPDPVRAKAYFHAALDALQSGNRPADALALGEREIGPLMDDTQTLVRMVQLARAAARPDVADRYMRKLLRVALAQPPDSAAPATALADAPQGWVLRPVVLRLVTAPTPAATYDDGARWLQPPGLQVTHTEGWRTIATANAGVAPATAQPTPARPAAPPTLVPGLPFDEKIYSLAYQVFLENRKPDDAWAIARAAVQQRPGDIAWRERLARVSEWTERPGVALEHWLVIAQKTQRDDAWQAVLRIAPGQFDDQALVLALRYSLRGNPSDRELIEDLIEAYERLGEPQAAMAYLQEHGQGIAAREQMALLAERMGEPQTALAFWREVLATPENVTPERAMHAAVLALVLRQPDQGLAWLEAARDKGIAPAITTEFWRMTGQLAESRQRQELAIEAYRKLAAAPDAGAEDFEALVRLLAEDNPLEAARINELAWRRLGTSGYLVSALTFHVSRSRWADVGLLLREAAKPVDRPIPRSTIPLMQMPEFLRLAGTYYQNTGDMAKARAYFEAGLRAAPDSADMRSALLWLFIDSNDAVALRKLLGTNEPAWSADAALHDSLASAYQALSLPQTALDRYLTPRIKAHEGNFLWLMNYADALDQNQQFDQAWRLRRHLLAQQWQQVRARHSAGTSQAVAQARRSWLNEQGLDQTRRVARTRLVLSQGQGDPAMSVLRELLRLDRDAEGSLSNAAAEAAIGWLQDAGEYTAERGFLWHQYARSQSLRSNRPLWADITVALAEDDKASSGQLLETFDERLPRYDRVNAARAVDDMRLAQTAAFEGLEHQNDDQPLHLQLTESLLAFSDHASGTIRHRRLGGLREHELGDAVHIAINPRLSLDLEHGRILRRSTSPEAIVDAPNETAMQARLSWRQPGSETKLTAGRRRSFDTYTPVELEHEQRIDNRLLLRMSLGLDLPSQESLALRVAGMKDRASVALRYQPTRQDSIIVTLWGERYQLQTGGLLGKGRHSSLYYTHSYRQDAPQLDFSAFWSHHAFRRSDLTLLSERDEGYRRFLPPAADGPGPDYFLPHGFSYYGLQIATNMRQEQEYTRKLRPFAAVSLTRHSQYGTGYGLRLGVAGNVLGPDHLTMSWGLEKSGLRTDGPSREVQISYRLHF